MRSVPPSPSLAHRLVLSVVVAVSIAAIKSGIDAIFGRPIGFAEALPAGALAAYVLIWMLPRATPGERP